MSRNPPSGDQGSPPPGVVPESTPPEDLHGAGSQIGAPELNASVAGSEPTGARVARGAHRARLYLYAFGAVGLLVYVVGLAASNTRRVTVDWVFGSSSVPLVWLVLFTAILGWLLGILISAAFRRRTRAPRA